MKGLIATLSLLLSLSLPFAETVCAQGDQYRFVMVSHIGANDPNMNWLTSSMKTFGERYPEVRHGVSVAERIQPGKLHCDSKPGDRDSARWDRRADP